MAQSENRLVSVVEHWLPRMEVAGIPSVTARAVIERAGVWERWLSTWSEAGERHAELGHAALAAGRRVTAGEAYARASLFYHFGQFMAFEDLEAKARAAARKVELYRLAAPLIDPPAEMIAVPFEGGELQGSLRIPRGEGGYPLALIIPGSDSTKEEFPAFERHFHARGVATMSLDGPGQGEGRSIGALRPNIGPAIQAAIKSIADHPRLSGKVVLVGMAFGGFLALRSAASVPTAAGVVSINGFFDLGGFWGDLPQVYRDNMRFSLGGEDVRERADRFTLEGCAPPTMPALILHGGRDRIFPPSEAAKCADICSSGAELHIFEEGNHVCNNIPWLYRPLVADWVAERLSGQ